jgi:hypothetical protein
MASCAKHRRYTVVMAISLVMGMPSNARIIDVYEDDSIGNHSNVEIRPDHGNIDNVQNMIVANTNQATQAGIGSADGDAQNADVSRVRVAWPAELCCTRPVR